MMATKMTGSTGAALPTSARQGSASAPNAWKIVRCTTYFVTGGAVAPTASQTRTAA
jgi:hypothetical protein